MNEMLQQRIEEAAEEIALSVFNATSEETEWITDACIEAVKQGANLIIDNLWISVDEALPKDFEKVFFRAVGKNDAVCFGTGYVVKEDWYTDIQRGEQYYFKFEITHWMPIPELKGGE